MVAYLIFHINETNPTKEIQKGRCSQGEMQIHLQTQYQQL
jgi:hypothetical protein